MTVTIPATTVTQLMAYPFTQDGVEGYMLSVPGWPPVFVQESDADNLGRYFLFGNRPNLSEGDTMIDPGEHPDEDPIDAEPVQEVIPEDTEPVHVDAPEDTPPVSQ